MPTYGLRPDDLVRDSRGDVAIDLVQTFYATRPDAEMQVNPLGTATSAKDGRWQFTHPASGVFGRDPEGNIRFYDSEEPKLTEASAKSTYGTLTEQQLDGLGLRANLARLSAYRPQQSDGLNAFTKTSGLTVAGGYYAATTGGTNADGIISLFPSTIARVSFKVKITKATTGSRSTVGFCNTSPTVMPSGSTYTHGFGYFQGSGLAFVRDNVNTPVVAVADASLTDGEEYKVALYLNMALGGTGARVVAAWERASDGANKGQSVLVVDLGAFTSVGNCLLRTNVAAGGITDFKFTVPPTAPTGYRAAGEMGVAAGLPVSETVFVRTPATPNGMAVLVTHGRGGTPQSLGWSGAPAGLWERLEEAGFTIFIPLLQGNKWGNADAQAALLKTYRHAVDDFKLDPRVFLWGDSMGGGCALTAIARKTVPVRAAYLAEPVCDLAAMTAQGSFAELSDGTVYPDTATRDQYDPMKQPVSAFAGVPLLFVASPSDTTVPKAQHTDPFRAKLGTVTTHQLITSSGNHGDASHYIGQTAANWFTSRM